MPLISTDDLKAAVGLEPNDTTKEALLELSVNTANALIAGYVGVDLSDTDTEQAFIEVVDNDARHMKLPAFPILSVVTLSADGNVMDPANYMLNERIGIIDFPMGIPSGARWGHRMVATFKAGYEEIPQDLVMACTNIAAALYNLGGTFASAASGGSGELKSLTMFDAMSMSFDVGGTNANGEVAGSPQSMISAWKFVLDKYRVSSPTLR
jgi:hypothetical protein